MTQSDLIVDVLSSTMYLWVFLDISVTKIKMREHEYEHSWP